MNNMRIVLHLTAAKYALEIEKARTIALLLPVYLLWKFRKRYLRPMSPLFRVRRLFVHSRTQSNLMLGRFSQSSGFVVIHKNAFSGTSYVIEFLINISRGEFNLTLPDLLA